MSRKLNARSGMAALLRHYHEELTSVDLGDFLERADIQDQTRAETHFESMVREQFDRLPEHYKKFKTEGAYHVAVERFTSALSDEEKSAYVRLNDHEGDLAVARSEAAFRLGIEVGRILGGGVR